MIVRNSPLLSYGVALLSVAVALAVSLLLSSFIHPTPLALFYMAVMVSAWYGGMKPGLVTTVLSTLAINYFLPPYNSLSIINPGNLLRLGVFVSVALLINGLNQSRRVALRQEQRLRGEAETAQRRTAHLLEQMTDAFVALDRHWRYTYANPTALQLLQKSLEDLIGKNVWEMFPSEKGGFAYRQLRRALEEQISVSWEEFSEPVQRWLEVRAYPSPEGIAIYFQDISERKQSEAALRQSEEQLRLATEGANLGLWHWDVSQDRLVWTDQCKALFGLPADTEMSYQVFLNAVHPDDRQRIQEMRPVLEDGQLEHHEIEYRTLWSDGTVRWLMARGSASYDADRKPIFSRGVIFDITDRKRIEEDLRRSEAAFRTISNAAPALVWVCSPKGENILFNDRWYEFTGQTEAEAFGLGWAETMHPDDATRILPYWKRCQQTGETYEGEVRYRRYDGEYCWHVFRALPRRNADGDIEAWYGLSVDISDRKQIEVALRQNEDRLRLAIEAAQLGTWDWNLSTNELLLDEVGKTMFGLLPEAEASFEACFETLHSDDRERLKQVVQWSLNPASGGIYNAEYRTVSLRDGTERWIKAKGQVYFDPGGHPRRFIGTLLDITEQKRAETEREQLLAREQAAREAAESANRIKDEFLAVVSHELRSPLNPILGWSKLLRTRQLDQEKTDRALEVIERNAQMQAQLINDLLDVSRILRGKLSLDSKPVDLVFTIQAAMETVRLAAEAKSIQIYTQCDPDVGQVAGDAGRLQQVVWNLLSNAVKFTSEGGRVDLQLEGIDAYAQITVRDTGKGIPADFLPYVFDQFRQESSTTTRRFGGLGLGLAIARHLVELHGGTVQADSPGEGQGATFIVKLPLLPYQPLTKPDPNPSEFSLNLQGTRILVVDDDDNTREFLAFLLELHGANVIATAAAAEAITTLTQFKPDVLLSDIGMPDVDGYMLMRQVRALPPEQGGTIPAIALTAYAGEIDYQQAMAAGFQRHITKPIEPQALIQAISALCNSTEMGQEPNFQGAIERVG
ncbi:MAG: PAS domain S-box protein [Leptolyngbyaceae cyanobacterium bins.302]|nr:PAS domain S-box protein [Leptolyngbyaceae cyanobacterium bins.302]